jgi:hypothetical protein
MKRKKQEAEINLLELIPQRNIKWEKNEEQMCVLLKPKFNNSFAKKHLLPRMKKPYFKVKLDKVGSFIWENCDGKRTVNELADLMKEKFGKEVEPLYDRLSVFLQHLEKNKFIQYTQFTNRSVTQ